MNLKELIEWYLRAFYIFGHYTYIPRSYSLKLPQNSLKFAPTMFLIVCTLTIPSSLFTYQTFFSVYYDRTDTIIATLCIFMEFAASAAVIRQSIYRWYSLSATLELFESIDLFLNREFQINLNFKRFLKRYILKLVLVIIVYMVMLAMKWILRSNFNDLILEMGFCAMRFLSIIAKMHALFYVSLFKSFIKFVTNFSFTHKQDTMAHFWLTKNNIFIVIKQLKIIHYKLYAIATLINNFFGWSLVMQMMQSLLDGSYALYWMFYYSQQTEQRILIIRKNHLILFGARRIVYVL